MKNRDRLAVSSAILSHAKDLGASLGRFYASASLNLEVHPLMPILPPSLI